MNLFGLTWGDTLPFPMLDTSINRETSIWVGGVALVLIVAFSFKMPDSWNQVHQRLLGGFFCTVLLAAAIGFVGGALGFHDFAAILEAFGLDNVRAVGGVQ